MAEKNDVLTVEDYANPSIILYQDKNFGGRSITLTKECNRLTDKGFNDTTSSVQVERGVWVLYQHKDYGGKVCIVWQGEKFNQLSIQDFNDTASSVKPIEVDICESPSITLYQHGGYKGRSLTLHDNAQNLKWYDFNDTVSSLKVHGGTWVAYQDSDYRGRNTLFKTGSYNNHASEGEFYNDSFSSFKILKVVSTSPIEIYKIDYFLDKANVIAKPDELFTWSQVNETSVDQELKLDQEKTVSREETYEFRWNQGASIKAEYEMQTGIPQVGFGKKITIGITAWYDVGGTKGSKTSKTNKWTISFPSKIPAKTKIVLRSTVQEGKIDVPFKAVLKQDDRTWEEGGTFKGVNFYEYDTKFTETPVP